MKWSIAFRCVSTLCECDQNKESEMSSNSTLKWVWTVQWNEYEQYNECEPKTLSIWDLSIKKL